MYPLPQYEQLAVATLDERYRAGTQAGRHAAPSRRDRHVVRGATQRLGTLLIGLGSQLERRGLPRGQAVVHETGR